MQTDRFTLVLHSYWLNYRCAPSRGTCAFRCSARSERDGFISFAQLLMFLPWPQEDDIIKVTENQTYVDPEAIPPGLRMKGYHKKDRDGGFTKVEPITTLRRLYVDVFVEIVRISYWIGIKEDGSEFYQVNLVNPRNYPFRVDQRRTLSLHCSLGCGFSEFEAVMGLLMDARRYIAWHNAYEWKDDDDEQ